MESDLLDHAYLESASLSLSLSFNLLNEFYKSYTREKAVHFSSYLGTEEITGSDNVKSREYCTSLHQSSRSKIPNIPRACRTCARPTVTLVSISKSVRKYFPAVVID